MDQPPITQVWESDHEWRPPACTDWEEPGFSTLVVTTARFHFAGGREALLRRIGAISELKGMQYWSTTHQQWRTLIVDAYAVTSVSDGQRRADFSEEELLAGRHIVFQQEDSLSGKGTYEIRIKTASADRLVFETRNLTTLRFMMAPIFHPGDLQSISFLDRESKDVWRYYNLARTGRNASALAGGHAPSWINRAVAFYRHLAGIPTDREPPAARQ